MDNAGPRHAQPAGGSLLKPLRGGRCRRLAAADFVAELVRFGSKGTDLADLTAQPFAPLLQSSILAAWFTPRHRLILSDIVQAETDLIFEGNTLSARITTLILAGSSASPFWHTSELLAELHTASGKMVASVPLVATPLAGSFALAGTFDPVLINPVEPVFVRMRARRAGPHWRIYYWQRTFAGRVRHNGLFGRLY